MREIKFRVYDENKNKIFEVMKLCRNIIGNSEVDYCYYLNEKNKLEWLLLTEGILMQYTGLKDSGGNEIYEGDILVPIWEENSERYIVEWNNDNCCFTSIKGGFQNYIGDINNEIPYSLLSNMRLDVCKIIGNIHDNPELLKEVN